MPQGTMKYLFFDEKTFYHTDVLNKIAYLIIEWRYFSKGSNDERKYGFIAHLSRGGYMIIDSWDEETFA